VTLTADRIAFALADRFEGHGVDAAAMARHPAYRAAVAVALGAMDERAVIDAVVAQGGSLRGAEDVHRVLVARLRKVPELAAERARLAAERENLRGDAVLRQATMLAGLVLAGALPLDAAVAELVAAGLAYELTSVALDHLCALVGEAAPFEARP
jgi:hypothetical protein